MCFFILYSHSAVIIMESSSVANAFRDALSILQLPDEPLMPLSALFAPKASSAGAAAAAGEVSMSHGAQLAASFRARYVTPGAVAAPQMAPLPRLGAGPAPAPAPAPVSDDEFEWKIADDFTRAAGSFGHPDRAEGAGRRVSSIDA